MIDSRIEQLRGFMSQYGLDAYIVTSYDEHSSEFTSDRDKRLQYMTGFSGAEGALLVTADEALLWVRSVYFASAVEELKDFAVTVLDLEAPHSPEIGEYINSRLPFRGTLGLYDITIPQARWEELTRRIAAKHIAVRTELDLVDMVWKTRPAPLNAPAFLLNDRYSGMNALGKLTKVRREMVACGAQAHILSTLDDIAWLFNIRGGDVSYLPMVLCYAVVELDGAYLFMEESKLGAAAKAKLAAMDISILPYENIYEFIKKYTFDDHVLLSTEKTNLRLYSAISARCLIIDRVNPEIKLRSVKNTVQIENIRNAGIKDGVALVKLMLWLKKNVGRVTITELSASEYLTNLRKELMDCLYPSSYPTSAYGVHSAMIRYNATKQTDIELKREGLYLIHSGGQYFEGTTEVARTLALGELNPEQKKNYTLALRGLISFAYAIFPFGCSGRELDVLTRTPLWSDSKDYEHDSGHGIGYFSTTHEPPRIRWCANIGAQHELDGAPLEPGMVLTVQPGVYVQGQYGIRLENMLLCKEHETNGFGRFLQFEMLTLAPFDLDAIDPYYLSKEDISRLNTYHRMVYAKLAPYLTSEEKKWLNENTRAI